MLIHIKSHLHWVSLVLLISGNGWSWTLQSITEKMNKLEGELQALRGGLHCSSSTPGSWYCSMKEKRCKNDWASKVDDSEILSLDEEDQSLENQQQRVAHYDEWMKDHIHSVSFPTQEGCDNYCKKFSQLEDANKKRQFALRLGKKARDRHELELENEDSHLSKMLSLGKWEVEPVGLCCEGDPSRTVVLVRIDNLDYQTDLAQNEKGKRSEWIPFYRSSGQFSDNRGQWFPFYGVTVDPTKQSSEGKFEKAGNQYQGRFNRSFKSQKYLKQFNDESPNNDYIMRINNEPVLHWISKRLEKEYRSNREVRLLKDSEINIRIGSRNIYGVDLAHIPPKPTNAQNRLARQNYVESLRKDLADKEKLLRSKPEDQGLAQQIKALQKIIPLIENATSLPTLEEIKEEQTRQQLHE